MYELTEIYSALIDGDRKQSTRPILVNPTLITYVRDYGDRRRVCFGGGLDDYVDVEESMEHLQAYLPTHLPMMWSR